MYLYIFEIHIKKLIFEKIIFTREHYKLASIITTYVVYNFMTSHASVKFEYFSMAKLSAEHEANRHCNLRFYS